MENTLLYSSPIRDKEIEKNQIKVIKALRDPSLKQCKGMYRKVRNGVVQERCAIGVAHGVLFPNTDLWKSLTDDLDDMLKMLNITLSDESAISMDNDAGNTLPEMADILIRKYNFPNVPK